MGTNQTTLQLRTVDVQGDEKRMDVKRQKLEAHLMNIGKAEAAAHRNAHFHGSVIPEIKEECMQVPLLHLQAGENGHTRPNGISDVWC